MIRHHHHNTHYHHHHHHHKPKHYSYYSHHHQHYYPRHSLDSQREHPHQKRPQPDWPALSRTARHLLASLPPPTPSRPRETALARLLRAHPKNPFLWHALASHHAATANLPAAHAVLSAARRALPHGARGALHHLAATLHLRARDAPAALDVLHAATRSDPYAPLFLLLARLHARAARTDDARAALAAGLAAFPRSTALWRDRVALEVAHPAASADRVGAGRAAALAVTRDALDHVPACAPLWHQLARLEADAGAGPARLADVLYDALAACPQDAPLRLRLARIEAKRKGPRVARDVLAPVSAGPFPDVLRFLATLHFDEGELVPARELFRRAADLEANRLAKQRKLAGAKNAAHEEDGTTSGVSDNSRTQSEDEGEDNDNDNDENGTESGDERLGMSPARRAKGKRATGTGVKTLHAWALLEARAGNVDEARSLLTEARALQQTDPALWRAIGELEARERNFDEARRAFQNALALDPDDARVYMAWGRTEALAGDEKRAQALISKIDTLPPNRRRELGGRGERAVGKRRSGSGAGAGAGGVAVLFDTSRQSSSMGRSETEGEEDEEEEEGSGSENGGGSGQTVSLTPSVLGAALRERAMMAARDGRLADSITLLKRASRVEPSCAVVWRLLASQEKRAGGMDRVREVYASGLEQVEQRSKPMLLHWWGQDERAGGEVDEARGLFRKATVANPQYMSAWMSWGLLEKSEGRVDEACRIFEQATRRAEQDAVRAPFVFLAWGRLEEVERGRADAAAEIFQRGVKVAPSSGPLWTAWGLLEHRRANVARARDLLRKATEVDSKHAAAWHSWALLEARLCNFAKAETLFRTGNAADGKDAGLLTSWAQMEARELGDVARARDLFERATAADSKFAPALVAWATVELEAGNVNLARDVLDRATRIRDCGAAAWVALAQVAAERDGDVDKARRLYERAREADPADPAAAEASAALALKMDDKRAARKVVTDALAACGDDDRVKRAKLLGARAGVELACGDKRAAHETAQQAVRDAPRSAAAWHVAIDVALGTHGADAAARTARDGARALDASLDVAPVLARRAELEAGAGRLVRARTLFSDALRAHPARAATWRLMIDTERRFGDRARADRIAARFDRAFNRRLDAAPPDDDDDDDLGVGDGGDDSSNDNKQD